MYFEYAGPNSIHQLPIYGALIPLNEMGPSLLVACLLPLLAYYLLQGRSGLARPMSVLFVPALLLLATYVAACRYLDDLFINFEHPYNLLHHGRYSFSPSRMVDGTVEFLYYFLLTPFALSQTSLIAVNYYLFGMGIALGHLYLCSLFLERYRLSTRFVALVVFATYVPLVQTFAGGYGNGLVSLVFFFGIYGMLQGREERVWICAAMLPLCRPDAILYSGALLSLDFLRSKRVPWQGIAATGSAALIYFAAVKLLYGHWIPNPMLFKSSALAEILRDPELRLNTVGLTFFATLFHVVAGVAALAYFVVPVRESILPKAIAFAWLVAMWGVFLFFVITNIGYNPTLYRYYAGLDLALIVVAISALAEILESPVLERMLRSRKLLPAGHALASAFLIVLVAQFIRASLRDDDGKAAGIEMGSWDLKRLNLLTASGRYMDELLPPGWTIATTELDSFGFMSDREIVDLWGYANPDIARSTTRSPFGVKNDPQALFRANAEVMWVRTCTVRDPLLREPRIEDLAVKFPNLSKRLTQAGDLLDLTTRYDFYRIGHGKKYTTLLLVRNDLRAQFAAALEANGLHLRSAREIDRARLNELYNHARS